MPEHQPEYLIEKVRERLATDDRVAELELQVSVAGDRLVVSGTVPTEERRAAVAEVAREAAPDHRVVNETEVLDRGAAPREEELG